MSPRSAGRLAWSLGALALLLFAGGLILVLATTGLDSEGGYGLVFGAMLLVFSSVGGLVASRHPGNATGWIFCGAAVWVGVATLADGFARLWLDGPAAWQWLGEAAAVLSNAGWIPLVLVPATFLLLLFPDGRLLSRRWRPVAWCAGLGISGFFVAEVVSPGPLEDFPDLRNPYGIDSPALDLIQLLAALMLIVALIGSPLSLVLRMRRAAPDQRQQIKWLVWAGGVAVATFVIGTAGYEVWGADISNAAILLSLLGLPVATGVAILRYRLYDIDVVINRTLVYAALTATLAAVYLGLVLLFQLILSPVTEDSDLAIAGSTLAVAALFRPARIRIQAGVDRRFYRRRYDAQRTLDSFSARLRDEVALDALSGELRTVVADTMQPEHVSLWIRGPAR